MATLIYSGKDVPKILAKIIQLISIIFHESFTTGIIRGCPQDLLFDEKTKQSIERERSLAFVADKGIF